MAESEEDLKSFLMRVKRRVEKPVIRLNIQRSKITASGLITSGQIEEEKSETVKIFIFLSSKLLWTMTRIMKFKHTYPLEGKL